MIAARGKGLALGYNGRVAVEASDFTIPRAGLTAVIGPNGSGKSTLLHALSGLVRVRAGEVEVLGTSPELARPQVAYVLQATKVNEVMPVTVREVVTMGRFAGRARRRFDAADRVACEGAIERLGLADLADRHLTELSGGQRQRVFVAQGLAQQGELLLLDEPATGLDLVSRDRIITAVLAEVDAGTSVVVTTHELGEAAAADHVILMAGRVSAEGPPDEVLAPDVLSEAYGVGIVHLDDGSVMLDDAAHRTRGPHVHFSRKRRP